MQYAAHLEKTLGIALPLYAQTTALHIYLEKKPKKIIMLLDSACSKYRLSKYLFQHPIFEQTYHQTQSQDTGNLDGSEQPKAHKTVVLGIKIDCEKNLFGYLHRSFVPNKHSERIGFIGTP